MKQIVDTPNEREHRIRKEMTDCIHFSGIQHERCKAGIHVRELVGGSDFGWAARLPCLGMDAAKCEVECPSRNLPNREEAEAIIDASDKMFDLALSVMRAAKQHAKQQALGVGNGGRGEIPCPSGCGGTLRYSVASVNGHMHAACTSKGCVSWME